MPASHDTSLLLQIDALSVGYADHPIVTGFSTDIARQTVTSLIGGNGAGKSTLLKSLFGLTRHFSGSIRYRGDEIQRLSPAERLARGIGIVPQGRCNFPMMSVAENLEMGAYTLPLERARRARAHVLELFPMLKPKLRQLAGNLSGGEQQILETAMVLQSEPELLLLDEPSLGLAPIMQDEVFENVDRLRHAGVTIVMAEQNVYGSLLISDRAIVLDLGRKFMEGEADAVMSDPRIRTAFLGGEPEGEPDPQGRFVESNAGQALQ